MIKIIIIEDNNTILNGLVTSINEADGYQCVAAYKNCEKMLTDIGKISPDIVLIDLSPPGLLGISFIKKVKNILHDPCILILTSYEEVEMIFQALCAGACGYLLKHHSSEYLIGAIRVAIQGGAPMSSHIARQVLNLFQKKINIPSADFEIILSRRERKSLAN